MMMTMMIELLPKRGMLCGLCIIIIYRIITYHKFHS